MVGMDALGLWNPANLDRRLGSSEWFSWRHSLDTQRFMYETAGIGCCENRILKKFILKSFVLESSDEDSSLLELFRTFRKSELEETFAEKCK